MFYSNDTFDRLYLGASKELRKTATEFRKEMTEAEAIFWNRVRNRNLCGKKFRREHPLFKFIVDFYCPEKKLVVEIDGKIHDFQKEYDERRTYELEKFGIKVLRFANEDILNNIENVLEEVKKHLS